MKQKGHQFMRHDRLGYFCTCPTNLGTVVRCSAHIQLKVSAKLDIIFLSIIFIDNRVL